MTYPTDERSADEPTEAQPEASAATHSDADAADGSEPSEAAEVVTTAAEPATEPATQVSLVPSPPPSTGEPRVDEAVDRLAALDELPVTEHVAVFDETHRMLQDALADLDEG